MAARHALSRQPPTPRARAAADTPTATLLPLDEGVSGTKDLDHRDGLSDLLARVRGNGVRLVLVERADRLARDLMVGEVLLAEFRKLGVAVVAADSGTDLTAGIAGDLPPAAEPLVFIALLAFMSRF
jgi:DNA invertase Pin-like site-specific DNA recombinase